MTMLKEYDIKSVTGRDISDKAPCPNSSLGTYQTWRNPGDYVQRGVIRDKLRDVTLAEMREQSREIELQGLSIEKNYED